MASLTAWLAFQRKVRIRGDRPLLIDWVGEAPENDVERAFLAAIEGGNREEDYSEVLEALHHRTWLRMREHSGRLTALRYRTFVDTLWQETEIGEACDTPGLEAWLILRDVGRNWEKIRDHEAAGPIRRAVLVSTRLESILFSEAWLEKRCAEATEGFFRMRRDLLRSRPHHRMTPTEQRLLAGWVSGATAEQERAREEGTNFSDPAGGNPDT